MRHRGAFPKIDHLASRASIFLGEALPEKLRVILEYGPKVNHAKPYIHVNGKKRRLGDVVSFVEDGGGRFHRVKEPEWFGCATNHLMSRRFLERFSVKLEEHDMYDVLDLPFAGSALEVIWGFIPIWLGFDKWFTDGFHRVRKDFVTYRREDDPEGMASYINRYHRGRLCVGWQGHYVKIKNMSKDLAELKDLLNDYYF